MIPSYIVETFTADISVDEYVNRFRDEKKFIELCKQCPNYGNSWGCPPFDFNTTEFLHRYKNVYLIATKLTLTKNNLPINNTQELIRPERLRLEKQLLDMEKLYGGRAFAYIGRCLHCNDAKCTRRFNQPCLHPDKIRPSLEAFGFDIGRTLSELFGLELLWGKDGKLPEYLVLVSGFFHNEPSPLKNSVSSKV